MEQPSVTPGAVQTQPIPPVPAPGMPSKSNGLAIAALVLGIISFLFGWTGFFNLLVAMLAVVFGIIALAKHQNKGFALTGTILGGIGLLTSIIVGVFFSAALLSAASTYDSESAPIQSGQDTPAQDRLILDDDWIVDANTPGMTHVTGTVTNNSDQPVTGDITISFAALDSSGANVGDCTASVATVDANGKWKFEAMCTGKNIANVRFTSLTGF